MNVKKIFLCVFVLCSYTFGNSSASTKRDFQNGKYWLNFNSGRAYNVYRDHRVLAGGLVLSRRISNSFLSIRYLGGLELVWEGPLPPHSAIDLGILYGKYFSFNPVVFCLSAGVGHVHFRERGEWLGTIGIESYDYEAIYTDTIGLPAEIQIFLKDGKVGPGISLFMNVNPHRNIYGILLFLQIRKF